MKKALLTAIVLGTAVLASGAFAQSTKTVVSVGVGTGPAGVSHKVTVNIPKVVVLQVLSTDANAASVNFDFTTAAGLTAYQQALDGTAGSPDIAYNGTYDSSNLNKVQVLTNSGSGANVTVVITPASGNVTGSMPASDVLFNGSKATGLGQDITVGAGTGWQLLADSSYFSIHADAAAKPGSSSYTVTYTATAK